MKLRTKSFAPLNLLAAIYLATLPFEEANRLLYVKEKN